ncbi:MAG: DUF3592 domain-containing protein [bacterium]|nr:DUF3592 domain-containing protein [bacterium]
MFSDLGSYLPNVAPEWYLLAVAVVMVMWGSNSLSRGVSAMSGTKQEGRIESADVRQHDFREYAVVVDYSYEAGGQKFQRSQRVFPTVGALAEKAEAEWERSKYREGAAIPVWVDPRNPASCTLKPGATYGGLRLVAVGVMLAGAGMFIRLYGVPSVPSLLTPETTVEAAQPDPPS